MDMEAIPSRRSGKGTVRAAERKPNFTSPELDILIEGVMAEYDKLYGRYSQKTSKQEKDRIWSAMIDKINVISKEKRTLKDTKRRLTDLRYRAKRKITEQQKHAKGTGGEPAREWRLTEHEERIRCTIGHATISGISGAETGDGDAESTDRSEDWAPEDMIEDTQEPGPSKSVAPIQPHRSAQLGGRPSLIRPVPAPTHQLVRSIPLLQGVAPACDEVEERDIAAQCCDEAYDNFAHEDIDTVTLSVTHIESRTTEAQLASPMVFDHPGRLGEGGLNIAAFEDEDLTCIQQEDSQSLLPSVSTQTHYSHAVNMRCRCLDTSSPCAQEVVVVHPPIVHSPSHPPIAPVTIPEQQPFISHLGTLREGQSNLMRVTDQQTSVMTDMRDKLGLVHKDLIVLTDTIKASSYQRMQDLCAISRDLKDLTQAMLASNTILQGLLEHTMGGPPRSSSPTPGTSHKSPMRSATTTSTTISTECSQDEQVQETFPPPPAIAHTTPSQQPETVQELNPAHTPSPRLPGIGRRVRARGGARSRGGCKK